MSLFQIRSANFWIHVAIAVALLAFAIVGVNFGAQHFKHGVQEVDSRPLTEKMVELALSDTNQKAKITRICTDAKFFESMTRSEQKACASFFPEMEHREAVAPNVLDAPPYKRFGGPGDD